MCVPWPPQPVPWCDAASRSKSGRGGSAQTGVVVRSGPELRAFSVRFLCLVSGVRKCALQCSLAEPRFTVSPTKETENYMAQSSSLGSDQLKSHMGHPSNGGQQWKDKSSFVFSSMGTGANLIASLPFLPNSP